jgi:hypothetical protein
VQQNNEAKVSCFSDKQQGNGFEILVDMKVARSVGRIN